MNTTLSQAIAIEIQTPRTEVYPGGAPLEHRLLLKNQSSTQRFSITLWISTNDKRSKPLEKWYWLRENMPLVLSPNEEKEIDLSIEVPQDVEPGIYSYDIVLQAGPPGEEPLRRPQQLRVIEPVENIEFQDEPRFFLEPTASSDQPYPLQPGQPFPIRVKVFNHARQVDRFFLKCPDLPPDWFTVQYPETNLDQPGLVARTDGLLLNPGDEGELTLVLHPPKTTPAGHYSYTLRLTSTNLKDVALLNILYLHILVDDTLEMDLRPRCRTIPSPAETFQVRVFNTGNICRELELVVADPADWFTYTLDPDTLDLHPGEEASVTITPNAKRPWRRGWRGNHQEVPFTVTVIDGQIPQEGDPALWENALPTLSGTLLWQSRSLWLKGLLVSLLLMVGALGLAYWLLRELVVKPSLEPQINEFSSTQQTYSVTDGNPMRLNWTIQNPEKLDGVVVTVYSETGENLVAREFNLNEELSSEQSSRCNTSIYRPSATVQLFRRLYGHPAEQTSLTCLGMGLEESDQPLQLLPGYYQVQLELFEGTSSKHQSKAEEHTPGQKNWFNGFSTPFFSENRFGNSRNLSPSQQDPDQRARGEHSDKSLSKTAIVTQRLERLQITPALPAEILSFAAQNQTYRWPADTSNTPGIADAYPASPIRLAWSIRHPETVSAIEVLYDHTNYTGQTVTDRLTYPVRDGQVEGLGESCRLQANQLVCRAIPVPTEAPGLYTVTLALITDDLQTQQRIAQTLEPIEVRPPLPQILSFTVNDQDVQAAPHQYFEIDPEQDPMAITLGWSVANPEWMQVELLPAPGQVPADSNSLTHTLAPLSGSLSFILQVTNPVGEQISRSVVIETTVLEPEPPPLPVVPEAHNLPTLEGYPVSTPAPKPGPVFNLPPFEELAPAPAIEAP